METHGFWYHPILVLLVDYLGTNWQCWRSWLCWICNILQENCFVVSDHFIHFQGFMLVAAGKCLLFHSRVSKSYFIFSLLSTWTSSYLLFKHRIYVYKSFPYNIVPGTWFKIKILLLIKYILQYICFLSMIWLVFHCWFSPLQQIPHLSYCDENLCGEQNSLSTAPRGSSSILKLSSFCHSSTFKHRSPEMKSCSGSSHRCQK